MLFIAFNVRESTSRPLASEQREHLEQKSQSEDQYERNANENDLRYKCNGCRAMQPHESIPFKGTYLELVELFKKNRPTVSPKQFKQIKL